MRNLSRLVWSEGMYLGPHHFQAQSRYFEDTVQFALSSLYYAPYGLAGCALDEEAVRNGTLSLLHARGILPDGLVFQMPECDPLPAPREFRELFSPIRDSMTVSLAVPRRREAGLNTALEDDAGDARYLAETRPLHDENTGRDEKPVCLGRKNIRLLLDTEPADDLVTLPIARVLRDGAGHFLLDPAFVPPSLEIGASPALLVMLDRLIQILEEKCSTLAQSQQGKKIAAAWSGQEVASFWFLHCVNQGLAELRHERLTRRGHPEQLYVAMARLAGGLCTFGLESDPRNLPLYDHAQPQACFEALDQHIRAHLETIIPTSCVSIPLEKSADYFWIGQIADSRCLGRCQWILAIHSPIGDSELILRTPQLVKVCSQLFVPKLVQRALPGMQLTHLPAPPTAVSPKVETQYFSVSRTGPCWDHILQTHALGIYVPGDIPEPEIEMLVILES